jgi:ketosteroid isomerase-like protein
MANKPDFDKALQRLLDAISSRNLDMYKAHITKDETMYTIVQNGHAFKTSQELIAMHEEWFKDKNWIWEGSVIHKIIGEDMAMALIRYDYRAKAEDKPFSTWLTYVFRLEDNEWRIIHDHNTALDFHAFAKSAGIS